MSYTIQLMSPAEREARIRASVAAATKSVDFYDFRSQKTTLPVIRIDIGVPIYRMENFRTFTDQTEYLKREGKPSNYFLTGQENESVQQLQHDILVTLAKTGRADSVVAVIDVLERERQREEILITARGVVVNGNRRLAAMRELYTDPARFPEFSHVDCAVLPEDATAEEIVEIEAALQAKPETKLDYDWIGECQLINRLLEFGHEIPDIAKRLNRKEKEVRNSLQALTEADLYLKDWVQAEGEYSRVREAEQFFKDIPDRLQGKNSQLEEGSRVVAWTLFDNRGILGERLYAFNVAFGKRAADVLDRVAENLGIPLGGSEEATDESGDFDVELDEEAIVVSYDPIIEALKDTDKKEEAVETLIEACVSIVESERNQKSGAAALRAVTTAHSRLVEVDLSKASPNTYVGIDKQLDAVLQKAGELKAELLNYRFGENVASSAE